MASPWGPSSAGHVMKNRYHIIYFIIIIAQPQSFEAARAAAIYSQPLTFGEGGGLLIRTRGYIYIIRNIFMIDKYIYDL